MANSQGERTGGNSGGNSRLPLLLYERRLSNPREFRGVEGEAGPRRFRGFPRRFPRSGPAAVNFSALPRHFAARSSRSSRGIPRSSFHIRSRFTLPCRLSSFDVRFDMPLAIAEARRQRRSLEILATRSGDNCDNCGIVAVCLELR